MRLLGRLRRHAAERGDAVAVSEHSGTDAGRRLTWSELTDAATTVAAGLGAVDPTPGLLALLAGRTVDAVAVLLGALMAGWSVAPLDPRLRWPQIAGVVSTARRRVVDGRGVAALGPGERREWWGLRARTWLTGPRAAAASRGLVLGPPPWEGSPGSPRELPAADEAAVAGVCLLTSGSTGVPRGVLAGRDDLSNRAHKEAEAYGLGPADVLLGLLPWSFDVGLSQLLSSVHAGSTLFLVESWLPADLVRVARAVGATGISGVPAIWSDLLDSGLVLPGGRSRLRYVTVSGGDLPPARLAALRSAVGGAGIIKTYGQTETFRTTWLRPEELAARPGSVGRTFPGARFAVVREDGGAAAPDEIGEVVHAGLGTMLGYLDGGHDRVLRTGLLPGEPETPAVATGDLGSVDRDGYLALHGRRDAMVKVRGNRVYPEQVAAALRGVDGVAAGAVVGVEVEPGDARLVAFVTGAAADPGALRRELGRLLPGYMVPFRVVPCEMLPTTHTGKPDLAALREAARRILGRKERSRG